MKSLFNQFKTAETVAAVFLYLLCIYIYGFSYGFPDTEWRFGGSPAFYPRILALLLFIFATALIWEGKKRPGKFIIPEKSRIFVQVVAVIFLFAMPIFLLKYLGFRIPTTLFLFVLMLGLLGWRVEKKRLVYLLATSVLTMLLIYIAFAVFANVSLPEGVWF